MKLRTLIAAYAKVCLLSWLTNGEQAVYMNLTDGTRVILATYVNGKRKRPDQSIDFIPVDIVDQVAEMFPDDGDDA